MDSKLKEILDKAQRAGACRGAIDKLHTYNSFEEASKDPNAPYWAYWYACEVIEGRWPEAEPVILTSPQWAYWYARDVIESHWLEAGLVILTSPRWTYWYTKNVLKRLLTRR